MCTSYFVYHKTYLVPVCTLKYTRNVFVLVRGGWCILVSTVKTPFTDRRRTYRRKYTKKTINVISKPSVAFLSRSEVKRRWVVRQQCRPVSGRASLRVGPEPDYQSAGLSSVCRARCTSDHSLAAWSGSCPVLLCRNRTYCCCCCPVAAAAVSLCVLVVRCVSSSTICAVGQGSGAVMHWTVPARREP